MDIKKILKKRLLFLLVILVLLAVVMAYIRLGSRTKIGVINYPEYMFVKMARANDNRFIKLVAMKPDSLPNLTSYDMLLVWGMGIRIPEEQEAKILKAKAAGVKIHLNAATNPRLRFTNLEGKQLDAVSDYIENGGSYNFKNLLNYVRNEIDGKKLFTHPYAEPKKYSSEVLFYTDEEAIFDSIRTFENYCLDKGYHKQGAERIVLFTSVPGPFNANRDHLNSLIDELQSRGFNIYPVSGMQGRMEYIRQIAPSLIVYMPHGRLAMGGNSDQALQLLKQLNVPVICPLSVLTDYHEWLRNKQGMFGGMLSQSVTMPELDGGIVPYTVVAQYKDENGYLVFRAIPERLKGFGDIVERYIMLKHKPNKDKKIAIIYYKGHGKNALEAAGLEVLPSLYNVLKRLKEEGYTVNLPADEKAFEKEIMQKGPVLGPYAEGAFDTFLKSGYPALVSASEYEKWSARNMPSELYADVVSRYGKAPGTYMAVSADTADYMAIARVSFGNVVLLPQPLPGLGDNAFELVHGANVAPPHSYIAPYMWIQENFKADAIIHFGTHGSLEFTPGKQIALSSYDWPDPLIGAIPHFYVYTISDPGEAMMAKRRAYATTVSHLTPPFIGSLLLDNKKIIRDKLEKYEQATGVLKREYALSVKQLAIKEGYTRDMGLDNNPDVPLNESQMLKLTNYLDELDNEKVTAGMYTMGMPYEPDKTDATVELMLSDAVAYSLANLDKLKGNISEKETENKALFTLRYVTPARQMAREIIRSGNATPVVNKAISRKDMERAQKWKAENDASEKPAIHHKKKKDDNIVSATDDKKLVTLVVKIISQPEKKEFILKLKSEKEYERAMSLLDPAKRAKARNIAKFVPAMKSAIEITNDSAVYELLSLLQNKDLKVKVLAMAEDPELAEKVKAEKKRMDSILVAKALNDSNLLVFSFNPSTADVYTLKKETGKIHFYHTSKNQLETLLKKETSTKSHNLYAKLSGKSFGQQVAAFEKALMQKENTETAFCDAVFSVKNTLENIVNYKQMLQKSPEYELVSLANSLNGGYVPPSPGGDPITNPLTLSTGRNLVSVSAESTPSKEAWGVGKKLGDAMLTDYVAKHGKLPKKVSYTLWSSEFIETEGATIAQVLYMLGVQPVWDAFGRVQDIKLIPAHELNRPRIDVVVQTSGQLRDLAASRLFLINRAIALAAADKEAKDNYVNEGVSLAEKRLLEKGFSPKQASELSKTRVFGGINGNYGSNIMGMVEKSDSWDSTQTIARTYINNMGAAYGAESSWGEYDKGVFEAALLNTDVVVQPRQSNTWGALSLDHVYEFMGGLNLAIKEVTGTDAESYMSDYRNTFNPRIQGLKDAIWVESRTTLLNPRYINEYMKGGASAAETFAETFRNTFAWNVMKPSVIDNRLWEELYDMYVEDRQNLGIHKFFETKNPYALQEMTAVMLETVRKGYWKATPGQVKTMSELHIKLVTRHDAGCSGFVCDNARLRKMISAQVSQEEAKTYNDKINEALEPLSKSGAPNKVLQKEDEKQHAIGQHKSTNNKSLTIIVIIIFFLTIFLVALRMRKK